MDEPTACKEHHEHVDIRWEPSVRALDVGARRLEQSVRPNRQHARCAIAHTPYKGVHACACVRACSRSMCLADWFSPSELVTQAKMARSNGKRLQHASSPTSRMLQVREQGWAK